MWRVARGTTSGRSQPSASKSSHSASMYFAVYSSIAHALFLRLRDDAIFDVGDVHHVRDLEAFELQVTAQDVSGDGAAEVADVTVVPDSWTTVIKAHLAIIERVKLFDPAGECVSKSEHGRANTNSKMFPAAGI